MTAASRPKSPRRNSRPRKQRRITARSVRRDPPDLKLLAKAIAYTIVRQAEEEAGITPDNSLLHNQDSIDSELQI